MATLPVQNAIAALYLPKTWLSTGGEQHRVTKIQVAELFNDMEIIGCN